MPDVFTVFLNKDDGDDDNDDDECPTHTRGGMDTLGIDWAINLKFHKD